MKLDRAMDLVNELKEEYGDEFEIGLDHCYDGPEDRDNYQVTLRTRREYEKEGNQRKIAQALLDTI